MSKESMKRFLIETSVENAEGSQTWYVDATSEAEALKQYEQGGCDLYASNIDVTSLGEPEIAGETTLDDFGDFAEQPAPKWQGVRFDSALHDQPAQPAQQQEPVYVYTCKGCKALYWENDLSCDCTVNGLFEFDRHVLSEDASPPAQPQQEPVAYWIPKAEQFCIARPSGRPFAKAWEPLYTSPPASKPWVGLTDEEWQDLSDRYGLIIWGPFKREIEAKLKEKNT